MTATLELPRRGRDGTSGLGTTPAHCDIPECRRSATRDATIYGWQAGRLCTRHAAEWRQAWERAAGRATEAAA